MRAVARLTQPITEPVSLAEIRHHVGISHNEDDAYLQTLVAAGRRIAENRLGIATTPSKWRVRLWDTNYHRCTCTHHSLPVDMAPLPRGPVLEGGRWGRVELFELQNDGTMITVPENEYSLNTIYNALYIKTGRRPGLFAQYWGGHVDPREIPQTIRQAIAMVATILYTNRGDGSADGEVASAWEAVQDLLMNEWDGDLYGGMPSC